MPVFVENPVLFSKQRLKSELISHNIELPSTDSDKQVYVELYLKHVHNKSTPDFSSDDDDEEEEDQVHNESEEEESREETDMIDLSLLTNDQLKRKLLQHGFKPGPIVGSTRALYERKLHRLMSQQPQQSVNNATCGETYSDSEEDEELVSKTHSLNRVSNTETTHSKIGQSKETIYPQCFVPPVRLAKNMDQSLESSSRSFSITQLVEEIENRLSPLSKHADIEKKCSHTSETNRTQRDLQQLGENGMFNTTLYLTPENLSSQKQSTAMKPAAETVTDVMMDLFPDAAFTPTGIIATKRRSIKGAAGRPVQFKYPETPLTPASQEQREMQKCLVPLWLQIGVFLLFATILYFMYILLEQPLDTPFSLLLDSQEPISDELNSNTHSEDTNT